MLKFVSTGIVLAAVSSPALASSITCQNLIIPIQGASNDAQITLSIGPEDLLKQCTSSSGLPLTIVTPESGIQISLSPGESFTIPLLVEDPSGDTGEAVVVISRESAPAL